MVRKVAKNLSTNVFPM